MKHVVTLSREPGIEREAAGNVRKTEVAMNCAIDLHDNTQETTDRPWFNPVFCEDLLLISFRGNLRMARWIYQRPVDCCHPTELVVAKRLARLGDEWVIRWGFYYETDREGDFIVLGPIGGVLVLEVKGGELRKLSTSGRWEGSSRDHPIAQLSAEWRAVIDALRESANGRDVPFVAKALCLPDIVIDRKLSSYKEIDRNLIVDRDDLASFEATWRELFPKDYQTISKNERSTFLDSFVKEISPKAIRHFISETDTIILRHTIAEYHILDMLRGNRQLMIEGGPGSGKTWLALEQAFRFANDGLQVLFLCYNVALSNQLSALVRKRKLQKGEVIVRSWLANCWTPLASDGIIRSVRRSVSFISTTSFRA